MNDIDRAVTKEYCEVGNHRTELVGYVTRDDGRRPLRLVKCCSACMAALKAKRGE